MTATVEAAGVALVYEERGAGPAVVLVHGTGADRTVWRETLAELGDELRAIVYDRRGYGASGAPEPYGGTTVEEQADDAARLIEALGAAPALVCGHELGALVCLDLLRRHPACASAAVLLEPPLLALSPRGAEVMSELRAAVERGARESGPAGAIECYLEEVGGELAFERLGRERVDRAADTPRAFAADLAAAPRWSFTRRELAALEQPVTLVAGRRSGPWAEPARELAQLLPAARLVELDCGHFAHVERPAEVAAAIAELAA